MESHIRRIFANLLSVSYGRLLYVVTQLFGIPLFFYFWGMDTYGQWLILTSVASYLSLADFGVADAAAVDMTIRISEGKQTEANRSYSAMVFLIFSTFLGFLSLLAMFWFVLMPQADLGQLNWLKDMEVALYAMIVNCFVLLIHRCYLTLFRANKRFALGSQIINGIKLIETVALFTAISLGAQIETAAIILAAVNTMGCGFLVFKSRKVQPESRIDLRGVTRIDCRSLLKPASGFLAFTVSNFIANQGLLIIIGHMVGSGSVAIFSAMKTFCRISLQSTNVICHAFLPEFAVAIGENDWKRCKDMFLVNLRTVYWTSLFIAALLFLAGPYLFEFWTVGQVGPMTLFYGLVLFSFIDSITTGFNTLLHATNNHFESGVMHVISSIVAVLAITLLLFFEGYESIAVPLILTRIATFLYVAKLASRLTNTPQKTMFFEMASLLGLRELSRNAVTLVKKLIGGPGAPSL